ncbi:hypothetical protein P7K49_000482 [Saguinus oedipus]|uniref:RING finger protein 141 n=1 Tax=Saguinus oedipus TaxID=9490 RepID=A0ABQ9WBU3_SAGOE|nr:hypothetical protein P7K49_000482 [Saguinus oedipus]
MEVEEVAVCNTSIYGRATPKIYRRMLKSTAVKQLSGSIATCWQLPMTNFGSAQLVISKLPEKVAKHVTLVGESGSLTYEEFLGRVAELNDVTAKVASAQEKHLLFEVQPGSDSSAFWKVVVRVVCTKINKSSGIVEASRIMNLYQFIQLYKDITGQAAGVLAQSSTSEEPDESSSSVTSCQASFWMGRVKQLTDEEECCIRMDG